MYYLNIDAIKNLQICIMLIIHLNQLTFQLYQNLKRQNPSPYVLSNIDKPTLSVVLRKFRKCQRSNNN